MLLKNFLETLSLFLRLAGVALEALL